jgi:hypothetical protein
MPAMLIEFSAILRTQLAKGILTGVHSLMTKGETLRIVMR